MHMNNKLIRYNKKIIVMSIKFIIFDWKNTQKNGLFFWVGLESDPDPDKNDTDQYHW